MVNNRYQYETTPRKLQPEYKPTPKKYPKKSTARKVNKNNETKKVIKESKKRTIAYIVVIFGILFAISYRNSLLTESFSEIKDLKTDLAAVEKENEQLKVIIESNLNLSNVEREATEKLGMNKLTTAQTVYVNLPKEDYIEPATEEVKIEENQGWLKTTVGSLLGKIK